MEVKNSFQDIVCFVYYTDEGSVPVSSNCPAGDYTEQLFDDLWNQIGQPSVVIGSNASSVTLAELSCTSAQIASFDGSTLNCAQDPTVALCDLYTALSDQSLIGYLSVPDFCSANSVQYAIGDTGPGGGIVFYLEPESGGTSGLEAAPEIQGSAPFYPLSEKPRRSGRG